MPNEIRDACTAARRAAQAEVSSIRRRLRQLSARELSLEDRLSEVRDMAFAAEIALEDALLARDGKPVPKR